MHFWISLNTFLDYLDRLSVLEDRLDIKFNPSKCQVVRIKKSD